MKKIILSTLALSTFAFAKIDFDLGNGNFSTNLKISTKQQSLTTNINIKDPAFTMDEDFDYNQNFTQFTLDGNLYLLKYTYTYAKTTSSDDMKIINFRLPANKHSSFDIISFKISENNNIYSKTKEMRFSYYTIIQQYEKEYTINTASKKVYFKTTGFELSTKEAFYRLVEQKAYENKNFNYLIAFAYRKNNFISYGTAYYSFNLGVLDDLKYSDENTNVKQTRGLDISGMRMGYRATMQYNFNKFKFLLEADYNKFNIDKSSKITTTDLEFDETEINLYASIKYSF
jgi:hypothetical protein